MKTIEHRKVIELGCEDLYKTGICPICKIGYTPNGTGPSNNPSVTSLLKHLPSEPYLGGIPSYFHDWAYLVCKGGWAVRIIYGGQTYIAWDKASADNSYLELMKAQVEGKFDINYSSMSFLSRNFSKLKDSIQKALLLHQAQRNYLFVRKFGASSFGHSQH